MKVRLIERGAAKEDSREILVDQAEFLIGRGVDCNLRLPISSVSRHHCLIRLSPDEATVVDLGSSNGTYLNENQVRSPTALHTGDVLKVGTRRYTVDLGDQPGLSRTSLDSIAPTVKVKSVRRKDKQA